MKCLLVPASPSDQGRPDCWSSRDGRGRVVVMRGGTCPREAVVEHGRHLVEGVREPGIKRERLRPRSRFTDNVLMPMLPGRQLLVAPVSLDEIESEGAIPLVLVNVGDSRHVRTEDDLGVVLEEVDLESAVGQVHDDGPGGAEPGLEGGDTRQLIALPDLHVGAGL